MPSADVAAYVRLLEKRLDMIHEIDAIRDQVDDLSRILRRSLAYLARQLDASCAFVCYPGAYGARRIMVVAHDGLILHDADDAVNHMTDKVIADQRTVADDPDGVGGEYVAVPLVIAGEVAGCVGIARPDQSDPQRRAADEFIIDEAVRVLDTCITTKTEQQIQQDELSLIEQLDQIADEEAHDLARPLSRMLPLLMQRLDGLAGWVFGPEERSFDILCADPNGEALWRANQAVRHEVQLIVQEAHASTKPEVMVWEFDPDEVPDMKLAGTPIRCLVSRSLMTRQGERAGTIVIAGASHFSEGHRRILKRASAALDSIIISRRHTEVMVRRFSKYLGLDSLEMLLKTPNWLDPRPEQVVILSADLVGSTKYAHGEADPAKVFEHINFYLTQLGRIVKNEYRGMLDKYIGDEVMAVFGAPVPDSHAAVNAAECALRMQDHVRDLNEQRARAGVPVFDVKVTLGLVHGIVGEVGCEHTQTDYTVIGRDVNCVFRIASHAPGGQIAINEAMRDALADQYETELLEKIDARGVEGGLPVYVMRRK